MILHTLDQVVSVVGKSPAPRDLKLIDYIDKHAAAWLSYSHFAFLAFADNSLELSLAGGSQGFAKVIDDHHLSIPLASVDKPSAIKKGCSFGSLFMISAMEETLRLNGTVVDLKRDAATIKVDECYLHCAKSFRRSGFWAPDTLDTSYHDEDAFLEHASFLALATINLSGQVDVSPKGDPASILIQRNGHDLCFPDRPGNKRIDSFRNIIERPDVALVAMAPGSRQVLYASGDATLTTDDNLLSRFSVQGKTPRLATSVTPNITTVLQESAAISHASLWPFHKIRHGLNPTEIFKAHVKQSKDQSLKAKVARAAVSVPGAMEAGLQADYKKNMY